MHCLFPFPPFFYDERRDKALGGIRLFLTLAEELEFQEARRREVKQSEDERKRDSIPPTWERQR